MKGRVRELIRASQLVMSLATTQLPTLTHGKHKYVVELQTSTLSSRAYWQAWLLESRLLGVASGVVMHSTC